MKKFRYELVKINGMRENAIIEATDRKAALQQLRMQGGSIVQLTECTTPHRWRGELLDNLFLNRDLQLYNINMRIARQLQVGVPLLKALQNVAKTTSKVYQRALTDVGEDLRAGLSFAQALHKHARFFPSLMINVVAIGERSGVLPVLLADVAEYYKDAGEFKKYVGQIALYPCMLLLLGLVMLSSFTFFVVPTFASLYNTLNIPLHGTLQIFLWVREHLLWLFLLVVFSVLSVLGYTLQQKRSNPEYIADLLGRLPGAGRLYKIVQEVRFCRVFGMQLAVGIDLLTALEFTKSCVRGSKIQQMCVQVAVELKKGRSLYESLERNNTFLSSETLEFLATAEDGSGYAQMLEVAHEQATFNLKNSLETMKIYLQPVVFLAIALILAMVIVILLQPMLGILENIGSNW